MECVSSTKIVDIIKFVCYIARMITPEQCRSARAWLNWSQEELAGRAQVALSTVRDFEKGTRTPIKNNLDAIQAALEVAGVRLVSDGDKTSGIEVKSRISERDLILPALDLLSHMNDGFFRTGELISLLEIGLQPKGDDVEILENRSDTRFSQIVRNMVSHRKSPTNLIGAGYATYDKKLQGLTITDKGLAYLREHIGELSPEWLARVGRPVAGVSKFTKSGDASGG